MSAATSRHRDTATPVCFTTPMTSDTRSNTNFVPGVGARVTVTLPGDTGRSTGTVIEDFGSALPPADATGRTWAPPRRWAIALDSGRLVFADTPDLDNEDLDNADLDSADLDSPDPDYADPTTDRRPTA